MTNAGRQATFNAQVTFLVGPTAGKRRPPAIAAPAPENRPPGPAKGGLLVVWGKMLALSQGLFGGKANTRRSLGGSAKKTQREIRMVGWGRPSVGHLLVMPDREWWTWPGSNRRPRRCERRALPAELHAHKLPAVILTEAVKCYQSGSNFAVRPGPLWRDYTAIVSLRTPSWICCVSVPP